MNAQQARKLTDNAIQCQHDAEEARLQGALAVVYGKVKEAAEKGKSKVEVPFNGTARSKYPELFIGEWPILHWDGGERTDPDPKAQLLIERLKAEGYEAEAHYNCVEVSW